MTTSAKIRVCVAGATGWAASALCQALVQTDDLLLVAAISRKHAGDNLQEVLSLDTPTPVPIFATVEEALQIPCDVFFDYTAPDIAKHHVITALRHQLHVVVGTSGLTDDDYREIEQVATEQQRAVLAVGNFAISVVLLNKFSEIAARYMPQWEIIDYASDKKPDSPSGSALELANRLAKVGQPAYTIPVEATQGYKATRGATINHTQVHSVRLPGYVIALESIFGQESEKLILKHEAGTSAVPYVKGALLAIRQVHTLTGLKRGLDQVMTF
ncbi:4-hydroxy-tetrahydrodipicolinate reductase [Chitinophaga nivalis]|uniref:4-hydroxy-tetrahydrodipicolinate reductase n=1 Tax=Chitinophaga nivalis TaxID=2991709 RepID=A0ABT3IGZ4_9BACT|nr:4-hydroxy-tetrahydrodipicolinate reductase [Chitinophaga nivalis]MCW3467071.1 4-hydroxy-tetrahydrodipicolinate reductase [Chitinophaga nivalis]MCW3483238.1 4-hydroxy-tetrahydrodipicolinate reductase [Chitinophaga nivalis]